jgi:hypothetical protein
MKTFRMLVLAAAVMALLAGGAWGQPITSAKSGTIAWVEGKVFLGDQLVEQSLTKFPDVKENVVLSTEAGRAEILLMPGVVMHVGENSSFRMLTKRLIDTRLELLTGSAVISAVALEKDDGLTVVCKDGTVRIAKAGHYRFDADPARVKVFAGLADVRIGEQHIEVGGGKMATLTGTVASAGKFDKEDTDSLENWARGRDKVIAMANVSAARQASYGGYGYGPYGGYGYAPGLGSWAFNPYFGVYTYIPRTGRFCDPFYGYCYWSPYTVGRVYYSPPVNVFNGGGYGGFSGPSYPSMGSTSSGYSGTMASSGGSVGASAPAAASSGSSAASSAGSSSAGHGGGGGGGRGH